ncbi:hypothetical protein D3C84_264360 [compost metagenome]
MPVLHVPVRALQRLEPRTAALVPVLALQEPEPEPRTAALVPVPALQEPEPEPRTAVLVPVPALQEPEPELRTAAFVPVLPQALDGSLVAPESVAAGGAPGPRPAPPALQARARPTRPRQQLA